MGLTTKQAQYAKPGRHSDGRGLYLLVKSSGAKSWVLRVQHEGKRRDYGIGSFVIEPVEANLPIYRRKSLTLTEAREKARIGRELAKAGVSPASHWRVEEVLTPTFEQVARARAPSTISKRLMVDANRSDVEVWVEQVISSGARQLLGREMATAMELAECYERATGRGKPSAKTITSTFKKLGAYQGPHQVRVGAMKLRPLAIDRPDYWRNEPTGSWAAEMARPLSWHMHGSLPSQCLTTVEAQTHVPKDFSQNRAA